MRSPTPPPWSISAICPSSDPDGAVSGQRVRERYQRELAERGLEHDPAQLAVVARLDGLRARLIAATAQPPAARAHWLRTLLRPTPGPPVPGLYLWGSVGRGKTWLMDLFFESLPAGTALRRHFHRFMHEVHLGLARLKHEREPLAQIARSIARDARVLCCDELYVADIADAMILAGLFRGLIREGVTLVATANVAPADQYREGLQRARFLPAIALLEKHLEVVRIGGDTDHRLRQLTRAAIYLPLARADTEARIAALFRELAMDGGERTGTIAVHDRAIAVVRAAMSVAWFEFAALCSAPRSQDDYIEIAREYQSVIVSGVPVLNGAQDDEARRFIALVDEFYDRNVKLILSAAAAPGQLYRGERLQGLFARTASRLTEMQSVAYLAREHRP